MLYLTHPDDWYQGGYEAEMSLWGPLAADHLIARQMELVEALKAGEAAPVWSEESPNLSLPKPFEPRAIEVPEVLVKGIRAALCGDVFSAKATRAHNDANVLVLGARVVGLSVATVKKHTIHIFEKLGVESRTAATLRAMEVWG